MTKSHSQNKKDSGNTGAPGSKSPTTRRRRLRGNNGGSDDDSVDSKGNIRGLIAYSSDEDYSTDDTDLTPELRANSKKLGRAAAVKARGKINKIIKTENKSKRVKSKPTVQLPKKSKIVEEEDDEDFEDEDEEDDDEDYEDEDEDENDYDMYEEEDETDDKDDPMEDLSKTKKPPAIGGLSISFGSIDESASRNIPKRHNMKKETSIVRKFVKLVSAPVEQDGIDMQIDQFKALDSTKQEQLITALEKKPAQKENMMFKILTMNADPMVQNMILTKYHALQELDPSTGEYYKHRAWLEKVTSLPLGVYKDMPVTLDAGPEQCGSFMERAKKYLASAIYGQQESKLQILQFIASKIANPTARGLSLLLVGPPGIGKTSLIKNGIAKALDWPFQFISLGGDSDATTYTGHQLVYEGSHTGKIANALISAKSMSMILMFDELDKISTTAKGEEVQNLLIHMTDGVQNGDFEDKYLAGVPLDLSRSMFVFSGNDITKIDKVLLDRMIVIKLQGYDKKDKLVIAESFLLPGALKEVNLLERVSIPKEILEYIISEYAGEEAGVRELKRCIEQVTQKINMLRIFNTKDLPFHIPEFQLPFIVKKQHIDLFLKKKPEMDISIQRMYT
jgi:ATP-dependent Lon protease